MTYPISLIFTCLLLSYQTFAGHTDSVFSDDESFCEIEFDISLEEELLFNLELEEENDDQPLIKNDTHSETPNAPKRTPITVYMCEKCQSYVRSFYCTDCHKRSRRMTVYLATHRFIHDPK
jgi:uncharacterized protein YlaI